MKDFFKPEHRIYKHLLEKHNVPRSFLNLLDYVELWELYNEEHKRG